MPDPRPPRPSTRKLVLASSLVLFAAAGPLVWWGLRQEAGAPSAERYAYAPRTTGELPRLWQTPDFAYPDQHGTTTTAATLRGRPWVADFIFTQCVSACPMMTSRFVLLQRQLHAEVLRFVSFSVDPAHDTPAVLAQYAAGWNPAETRWSLLATEPAKLKDTLAGFRVSAKASGDPNDPIVHSSVFLLIDAEGWVRGVYESEDAAGRARLVTDAHALTGAGGEPTNPPSARLAALGCAGCHDNPRVAPALAGLHGSEVVLANGMRRIADEAYLQRSLLDPAAEMVQGYAPLMPSYAQLSGGEIADLVREIRALRPADGAARATNTPVQLAHDPVCHMTVRASPDALHARHEEHDVFFCSDFCRAAFARDPAKYPLAASAPDAGAPE